MYYPDALTVAKEITISALQSKDKEIYVDETYADDVAKFLEIIYKKAKEFMEER